MERTPEHLCTYLRKSCYDEEGIMGPPPQKLGSVGWVWNFEHKCLVEAIVLSDAGECCGGGDDIKVCVRRDPGFNDWDVYWIGALEFIPQDH